jgi:hypothetical protein
MDWSVVGTGFGIGIFTAVVPIILFLPASYIMNRFIYHHWGLRLLMGIIVGLLPVLSLIVVAIMRILSWGPANFFALIPLYAVTEDAGLPGGYFTFLYRILNSLLYPYVFHENPAAYKEAVEHLLVAEDSPSTQIGDVRVYKHAVPEFFFKESRQAGAIEDTAEWTAYMTTLEKSGVGQYLFGSRVKQDPS